MKKFFSLNLWPPEELRKKKEYLAKQQQQQKEAGGGGTVVVDGVDGGEGGGGGFGIRNYLHHFYVLSSPAVEEIIAGGGGKGKAAATWYLLPPPPAQRMGLYVCRAMTLVGMLLLLGGAAGIVAGYCLPRVLHHDGDLEASLMRIAIDQDEEGNFYIPPERLAELLRDPMHGVKLTGFCVFAIGASVMALGLLIPTFAQCAGGSSGRLAAFSSENNTPNEAPVRVYPGAVCEGFKVSPTRPTSGHKISPTSCGPVPVMEEMAKVQPPAGHRKSPSPIGGSPTMEDMLNIGGGGGSGREGSPLLQQR